MKNTRQPLFALALVTLTIASSCGPRPFVPPAAGTPIPSGTGDIRPASVAVAQSKAPRTKNPPVPPEDLRALAAGNTQFAFDLYRSLRAGKGNLFLSPYSISLALAMTFGGAEGDTASQMAGTMHFALPPSSLHPAFNAYSQDLQGRAAASKEGTPFELTIANSLWGQKSLPFRSDFLDLLAENYGAGLRLVDFTSNPEAARLAINQWVSDETKQKILDLIPAGAIDPLTRLVLANAIYFKAGWQSSFDKKASQSEPFHLLDGSTVKVSMMNQKGKFGYALMSGYRAIDLPYQTGSLSMWILLPDSGQFQSVEQQLNPGMITDLAGSVKYGSVDLSLPKFSYESSFNLNETLKTLGMTDAFDPVRADFSGMDGEHDLYIGNVMHKAFVSVDENGTEAAAATAVVMEASVAEAGGPIIFTVDRPFIFFIRDDQTGSLLFMGRVLDPTG
ncbi:MAG: serpin family protein [Anaerolineales bacterium]|jgi:serpin B